MDIDEVSECHKCGLNWLGGDECPRCSNERDYYACPDCACVDADGVDMLDCECPCHSTQPSDASLRREERRQMGIT